MKTRLLLAMALVCLDLFCARANFTNQVSVSPLLNFELLKGPAAVMTNRFDADDQILFMISSADGKEHVFALLPREQTFIFDLHDAKGGLLQKTALGSENSQTLDLDDIIQKIKSEHPNGLTDRQLKDYLPIQLKIRHNPVSSHHSILNNLFVPQDYFVITNKGIYTMDVRIRAWAQNTNGQYGIVISSPVRVEIRKN